MLSRLAPRFKPVASQLRLETLIRVRWLAVIGQTLAVLLVHFGFGYELPLGWCILVIALSAWLNVFLRLRYPTNYRVDQRAAAAMLAYDMVQLGLLLYLTGGLGNPFVILLIAPVTVSASALPFGLTIILGGLAVAIATLLGFYHFPLPWASGDDFTLPFLYGIGIWTALSLGISFIAFYAWRVAQEARQMADALAATEAVLAREQTLSALDGLAAAAAHELGTPLATISLVTKELKREITDKPELAEDITLLHSQAVRCREILARLTSRTTEADVMMAHVSLQHLITEISDPHQDFGIDIEIELEPEPGARAPRTRRSPGVLYGLGNLVENAVDFAERKVVIRAAWTKKDVVIQIADDGPGFPPAVLERLGDPFMTTRRAMPGQEPGNASGLGLGFFIAKTLLERSGGVVQAVNKEVPEHGAVVTITWPRDVFDIPEDTLSANAPSNGEQTRPHADEATDATNADDLPRTPGSP